MQRWTLIEKRRALELIERNEFDVSQGFREFANESGRSFKAIKNAWYHPLGALYSYRKEGYIFTTIGKKIDPVIPKKNKRSIYRFIRELFKK